MDVARRRAGTITRGTAGVVALALAAVVLACGTVAFAETYRDPINGSYVAVGTNGSDARTARIAVSQGGCAEAWTLGMAIGDSNRACNPGSTLYPHSLPDHDADGGVAVGLGGAEAGGETAVSDTGNAYACTNHSFDYCLLPGVAVSGTGSASGDIAVSGTNSATAPGGSGPIAVSGTGNATGGTAAVSGTGSASGTVEVEATHRVVTVDEPTSGQTIGLDNTGDVGPNPLSADQAVDAAYAPPPEVVAAKEAAYTKLLPEVEYQLAALQAGLDPTLADRACPDGRCPSRWRTLSQPITHQIRSYYCGPASTAIVLQQLTGSAWSQDALAARGWLNTTTDGTYYGSITKVLNNVFRDRSMNVRYTHTQLKEGQPSSYMTKLVAAVDYYDGYINHSIINNVKTSLLNYWGDKRYPAWHFNVSHGYDLRNGGSVDVAEVYDPTKVGSKRKTNPYGYKKVPLDQMYSAVMANKRIVIW